MCIILCKDNKLGISEKPNVNALNQGVKCLKSSVPELSVLIKGEKRGREHES